MWPVIIVSVRSLAGRWLLRAVARRADPDGPLAVIVVWSFTVRSALAIALFLISFFRWPILFPLQSPHPGF